MKMGTEAERPIFQVFAYLMMKRRKNLYNNSFQIVNL
mgnify:CR=1 FL=1